MFGRRVFLLLVCWVSVVSALAWIAQASAPVHDDSAVSLHSAGPQGQAPALKATHASDQVPLMPRLVSGLSASAPPLFTADARYKQHAGADFASPSRTLQRQRVRWQV